MTARRRSRSAGGRGFRAARAAELSRPAPDARRSRPITAGTTPGQTRDDKARDPSADATPRGRGPDDGKVTDPSADATPRGRGPDGKVTDPAADPGAPARALLATARDCGVLPLAVLLCSLAAAAAALALPAVLGRTLDLLLRAQPGAGHWLALSTALLAAEVLLDAGVALLTGLTNARATARVRVRALDGLLSTAPDRAARHSPGDVATRLSANATDAGTVPAAAASLAASLLMPAGALVALFVIDAWVALVFVAGLPALALVLRAFARDASDSVGRYQRVQADIASRLMEALEGARTIAAAGTAPRERARILAPLAELSRQGRRMWALHGRAVANSSALMPLLTVGVLGAGGVRLASGDIGVGELLAASRYAALAAGVGGVATSLGALVRGRAAARRTAELEDLPALRHGGAVLPPGGPGALELRGVHVVRDGAALLSGVDLSLPGGVTAAVVGRSGAGKSTLAAVAGRLVDPDRGHVLLDGVRLDEVSRDALREDVTYAFERPVFVGGTVAEAIGAGAGAVSEEQVRWAARAAGADGFVRRLPQGYDTPLADAPLSGGEYQRLGLARAFAHAGRLLILDDATSSLDTATEREVDRVLTREVRPGTRLLVAHRLSVAARADLVVWLEEGRLRAVDTHRRLWRDPAYRAVFDATEAAGTEAAATEAASTGAPGTGAAGTPVPGAAASCAPRVGTASGGAVL